MAWSDAGQRLEAVPTAGTGCDFAVSNRPAVSTPATATRRCRCQSLTTSGMIYDHVSTKWRSLKHTEHAVVADKAMPRGHHVVGGGTRGRSGAGRGET